MAEWTNVFDLGDWDIYVKYSGVTEYPTPDSKNYYVKAAELDPAIGSVSVVNGEIVCEMQEQSSAGGEAPAVVLMPKFAAPEAVYRLSGTGFNGVPWTDRVTSIDPAYDSPGAWDAGTSNIGYVESYDSLLTPLQSNAPLPAEQGIAAGNTRYGA